jgi:hypothetical protein
MHVIRLYFKVAWMILYFPWAFHWTALLLRRKIYRMSISNNPLK